MTEFKGSQSEKNLKSAFAGESMARNRYTFYAEKAREEGHEAIADTFEKLAGNEMMHAKIWFKMLHDGAIPGTGENIQDAIAGENAEWRNMYPEFAETARKEGFDQLAAAFEQVAAIEQNHEKAFLKLFVELEQAKGKPVAADVLQSPEETAKFRCVFCGATFEERPDVCSVCGAIGAFEEV